MTEPTRHIEHVQDWAAQLSVSPADRTVQGIALTGPDSKNGYTYSETALKEAAALYDQKPVFLDHAADRSRPTDRSTRDLVGSIINPRYEAGRIRGDIRLLDTDSAKTFFALVQSNAPGVGMSHVVLAQRSPDNTTVERIVDVLSVDAVINPATTRTFSESASSPAASLAPASDSLTSPSPLAESQHTWLLAENQRLKDRLHQLEQQELQSRRRDQAQSELQSALPPYAITPLLLKQFESATPTQRRELIAERQHLLSLARESPPHSTPRQTTTNSTQSDHHFITTLKR